MLAYVLRGERSRVAVVGLHSRAGKRGREQTKRARGSKIDGCRGWPPSEERGARRGDGTMFEPGTAQYILWSEGCGATCALSRVRSRARRGNAGGRRRASSERHTGKALPRGGEGGLALAYSCSGPLKTSAQKPNHARFPQQSYSAPPVTAPASASSVSFMMRSSGSAR